MDAKALQRLMLTNVVSSVAAILTVIILLSTEAAGISHSFFFPLKFFFLLWNFLLQKYSNMYPTNGEPRPAVEKSGWEGAISGECKKTPPSSDWKCNSNNVCIAVIDGKNLDGEVFFFSSQFQK